MFSFVTASNTHLLSQCGQYSSDSKFNFINYLQTSTCLFWTPSYTLCMQIPFLLSFSIRGPMPRCDIQSNRTISCSIEIWRQPERLKYACTLMSLNIEIQIIVNSLDHNKYIYLKFSLKNFSHLNIWFFDYKKLKFDKFIEEIISEEHKFC